MIYNIESKNDLSGAMLVIRFPEEELDKKALYTIESDQPPFLVPFSYRSVDGMAECTYRLGSRSKLQYRFGSHPVPEYVNFWTQVLQPLLDCDDWFLKPFSFVLDSRYLYADKSGAVSYLYVPSLRDCESFDTLRSLVMELSQQNSVTDPALENKVLRAIMQDFQPKSFLAMLRTADRPAEPVQKAPPKAEMPDFHLPESLRPQEPLPISREPAPRQPEPAPAPAVQKALAADDGEIHINLGGGKRPKPAKEKPAKDHKPLFSGKKEKPVKEKPAKSPKPLFGGKKDTPKEVLLGAAAEIPAPAAYEPPVRPARPAAQPAVSYDADTLDGATQLDDGEESGVCRLRLVGDPGMPREIVVDIQPGRAFTIGRFDVSVGQKQSDFEFGKSTKAVSRRHAAIEREENSYFVVDLASSAGTFVDGLRLTPNVPQAITNGSRISFGTGGADYVWVE